MKKKQYLQLTLWLMYILSLSLTGCNDSLDYEEIVKGEFYGGKKSIIYATNNDGIRIFYKITSESEKTVAVTSEQMNGRYIRPIRISTGITCNGVTYKVTAIGNRAFYHSELSKLTIPNTIKEIGAEAFSGSTLPEDLVIPNSVISIGENAFDHCTTFTSVKIPTKLKSIGPGAFGYCKSLKKITLPEGLESISERAFIECSSLTNVSFPNSIKNIGGSAFNGCSSISSIIIPNGITIFVGTSFSNCSSLKSIEIPATVTHIWFRMYGYSNLTEFHCKGSSPPGCEENTFEDNFTSCILYVPYSSKSKYQSATGWKSFGTIREE